MCVFACVRALKYDLLSAKGQLFSAAAGVNAKLLLSSRRSEFGSSVFSEVQPLHAVLLGILM